jgi:hypothetical protein
LKQILDLKSALKGVNKKNLQGGILQKFFIRGKAKLTYFAGIKTY